MGIAYIAIIIKSWTWHILIESPTIITAGCEFLLLSDQGGSL